MPIPEPAAAEAVRVALGIVVGPRGVLVTRRRADTVLGGLWEFPGGKVEAGEQPAACVVRELAEEVGLRVRVVAGLPVATHDYAHARVELHPYRCALDGSDAQSPQALQVADWRWVSPEGLRELAFPPANGPILDRLLAELAP